MDGETDNSKALEILKKALDNWPKYLIRGGFIDTETYINIHYISGVCYCTTGWLLHTAGLSDPQIENNITWDSDENEDDNEICTILGLAPEAIEAIINNNDNKYHVTLEERAIAMKAYVTNLYKEMGGKDI